MANGPAYVTFFFVLSGTVLALSLDRDPPAHPGAVLGYLVKRGFRLYPLLLFTAAAAALLQLYYFEPHVYSQATGWFNDGYKIDLPSLPAEFLANAQGRSATLNGPAWSIKVEILASAVFPLLYWLSLTPARAMVTAPLLVAAMFLAPGGAMQWHYMNVFLFCFFVGALVPRWGWKVAALLRQMGGWPRVALLAALVLVFMFSRRLLAPTAFAPPLVVVLESLAAGVGVVLLLHGRERAFFHAAPMELLARLSFGSTCCMSWCSASSAMRCFLPAGAPGAGAGPRLRPAAHPGDAGRHGAGRLGAAWRSGASDAAARPCHCLPHGQNVGRPAREAFAVPALT
ncbi:acyltransferase family protein [Pseudoroseomonas wenyumeiae]